MIYFRRFGYLLYYLKTLKYRQFRDLLNHCSIITNSTRIALLLDAISSLFKFNISLNDFFIFRFFELDRVQRTEWAGTGFMYEYQLKMNPKGAREVLADKNKFLNHFKPFVSRQFASIEALNSNQALSEELLSNPSGRLVLKNSLGQVGAEVEVIDCKDYTPEKLGEFMHRKRYNLAETYVIQHPTLMELSPSGLNTVRIITQINGKEVDLLGARLRISVNCPVDNLAAGNIAAPIMIETGTVSGPGVYSDITKNDASVHPVTSKAIEGFQVPFWKEAVDLAKKAAMLAPENRSVGWDIAITNSGPELIEGNHNWCKSLWQLPAKRGMRKELEKYL